MGPPACGQVRLTPHLTPLFPGWQGCPDFLKESMGAPKGLVLFLLLLLLPGVTLALSFRLGHEGPSSGDCSGDPHRNSL